MADETDVQLKMMFKAKFIQIQSTTGGSLYALDEEGIVWYHYTRENENCWVKMTTERKLIDAIL